MTSILIHLWPNDCGECNMCGEERQLNHVVAWYCGPTHDEIGSVSTEYRSTDGEPAIVGGMCVCKECHDRHYGIQPERVPMREGETIGEWTTRVQGWPPVGGDQ